MGGSAVKAVVDGDAEAIVNGFLDVDEVEMLFIELLEEGKDIFCDLGEKTAFTEPEEGDVDGEG